MKRPLCLIALLFLAAVFLWQQLFAPPPYEDKVEDKSSVKVIGRIYRKEYKGDKVLIYLDQIPTEEPGRTGGALCYLADTEPEPQIGSHVEIAGSYQSFSLASNLGQFNQKRYYQIENLDYSIYQSKILRQTKEYNSIKEGLFQVRTQWADMYDKVMPEKDAAVLKAMILGDRSDLDKDLKSLYQAQGISHILCISGLHISLIGTMLFQLLRRTPIPIWFCAVISMVIMLLYGIMTGGSIATVRAVVMFLILLLSKIIGRTYDMLSALAFTGILMLLEQPLYIFHAGFLLSFSAILGVGLIYPILEKVWNIEGKVMQSIVAGISISFFSLPILAWFYYEFPVYSLLLNPIIIPLMTLVLSFGLMGGGMVLLSSGLGSLLLLPCRGVLWFYETLCLFTELLPGSTYIMGKPQIWQMITFYIVILSIIIWKEKISRLVLTLCMTAAVVVLCITIRICTQITMLDIGQGDCISVETKRGSNILIDAGSTSEKNSGTYRVMPYLKARGINKIDYAILTHPDADHYNAIVECLDASRKGGIVIENLVVSVLARNRGSDDYKEILDAAERAGCNVLYIEKGDILQLDEMTLRCLYPGGDVKGVDKNGESLVLHLQAQGVSMLLTGDLGEGEEASMLREPFSLQADILKVGHHGSKYSSSEKFLKRVNPRVALVSCGKRNRYGHPHKETINRLEEGNSELFVTSGKGAITIRIKNQKYYVATFLE